MAWIAIGIGAACGAWLRWGLGLWLNTSTQAIPLGTLAANWLGGYAIGFLVALFDAQTTLAPEWRLLIITGFLGGLTTFSTFSAEAVALLQRGNYLWFFAHSAIHLAGAIGLCVLGFATFRAIFLA